LSATALITGCAAQRVIQPAAAGLPAPQVATIVTSKLSKMGGSVSLERVTDAQGQDAVSFNLLTADVRNSAIVVPGRYKISVICVRATEMYTPTATFELRGGYTYTMECNRPDPFLVGVIATEALTAPKGGT
jgi:hypothetical protein